MALESFPAYATLLFRGFEHLPDGNVLRDEFEAGPDGQTTLESRVMEKFKCSFLIKSKANYVLFNAWYKTTINKTGWFTWTEPLGDTSVTARIVAKSYAGGRTLNSQQSRWEVSMVIEYYA